MKILIVGYGKMGRIVEEVATARGHEIIARIDSDEDWQEFMKKKLPADVAIEFSTPDTVVPNIYKCFELNIPVVTGTTAWEQYLPEVKAACSAKGQSFMWASNFSLGVNLFFKLNKQMAKMMDSFDQYKASIQETHHTQKLDKPSGTAKKLAEDLMSESKQLSGWVLDEKVDKGQLQILCHRIDDVPGIHNVKYESAEDIIEIRHSAKSRAGFARGAVMAAEWLIGKRGCFTMGDMLEDIL